MSEQPAAGAAPTAPDGEPVSVAAPHSPLSPAQLAQLTAADQRIRSIDGAIKLAAWNGYSLLVGACLSGLFSLGDAWGLLSAALLGGFGFAELLGRKRLQRHDRRAPLWLCVNQLLLLGAMLAYSGFHLYVSLSSGSLVDQALHEHPELHGALSSIDDPQVGDLAQDMGTMFHTGVIIAYAALMVSSLLFQGGSALYYYSRKKHLDAFLRDTPAWVLEVRNARG